MAIEDDESAGNEEIGAGTGGKRSVLKLVLVILAILLLLGGIAAAVYFFLLQDEGAAPPAAQENAAPAEEPAAEPEYEVPEGAEALYLSIAPALTVNFSQPSGAGKYLQVLMDVMSRDRDVIEALKANMPAIRNDLILLLGEQDPVQLRTAAGKQQLQRELLRSMQRALARENRRLAKGIEAVYFTKFVIQ